MESVNVKERNTAVEIKGRVKLIYVHKKGMLAQNNRGDDIAFFQFGNKIESYLHLPHEYNESDNDPEYPDCTDTYCFFNEGFTFWVDRKDRNVLWRMRSDISFIFEGHELIGMNFDDFMKLNLLTPDYVEKDRLSLAIGKEYFRHSTLYYFCEYKLTFYVWRKRIRTVIINNPFFEDMEGKIRTLGIEEYEHLAR